MIKFSLNIYVTISDIMLNNTKLARGGRKQNCRVPKFILKKYGTFEVKYILKNILVLW